jgi:hypothetical protein
MGSGAKGEEDMTHTAGPCRCIVRFPVGPVGTAPRGYEVIHCPMHKAASVMYGQTLVNIATIDRVLEILVTYEPDLLGLEKAKDYLHGMKAGNEMALAAAEGRECD